MKERINKTTLKIKGFEGLAEIAKKLRKAADNLDEVNSLLSELTSREIEINLELDI